MHEPSHDPPPPPAAIAPTVATPAGLACMVYAARLFAFLLVATLLPMDLLARSRAVHHTSAPAAAMQPWLGAPTVGALGLVPPHVCLALA
jgi:hypothetical protein